jgi:hypothetical protein
VTAAKLADGSVTDVAVAANAAIAQAKVAGLSSALAAKADATALNAKADDTAVVHRAGDEDVDGVKNFIGSLQHSGVDVVTATDARLSDERVPADGSVTTVKLADGAVSSSKLQGAGQAGGIATLDGSGTLTETQVPARLQSVELSSTFVQVVGANGEAIPAGTVVQFRLNGAYTDIDDIVVVTS